MRRRTHAHKARKQIQRAHWLRKWLSARYLSANDRRVIWHTRGHVCHLWWATGERGIGRNP